jgi:hypothetical protein
MTMEGVGAAAVTSHVTQTMDIEQKVDAVRPDGGADILQTVRRIRMAVKSGNQEVSYDSASRIAPQGFAAMVAPLFQAMTSSAFKVTMTARGDITDVEIPDAMVEALKNSPDAAHMGEMATPDGFARLVKQQAFVIPETLEKNQEWSVTTVVKNAAVGDQTVVTTYRYEGTREEGTDEMDVFTPSLNVSFGGQGANGVQAKITGQESEGEVLFNRTAGRLQSQKLKQGMDIKITAGEHEMVNRIDQIITYQYLSEFPAEAPEEKVEKSEAAPAEAATK